MNDPHLESEGEMNDPHLESEGEMDDPHLESDVPHLEYETQHNRGRTGMCGGYVGGACMLTVCVFVYVLRVC